jgi:hypothetical protein
MQAAEVLSCTHGWWDEWTSSNLILFSNWQTLSFKDFFLIVGDGVQLGPLGTSATNWPVLYAPGDYDDGEYGGGMISRGNRRTRRKPAPVPLSPLQIPHDLTGREPGPSGGKQAINRLNYGTAIFKGQSLRFTKSS